MMLSSDKYRLLSLRWIRIQFYVVRFLANNEKGPSYNFAPLWFTVRVVFPQASSPTAILAIVQDSASHPQLSWLSPRTTQHTHNCPGYHPGQRSTPTTVLAITQDSAAHPQLSWLSPRTMQHTHNCPGYHPGQCSRPKIALVIIQESAIHQIVLFIIQGSATHLQLSSSSFRVV